MTCEEEVELYKNMVRLYKYDHLTGMKMRRDFEVETRAKMENQQFALVMYDVTGLHRVNREQGYEAGDALIRQAAMDIQSTDGLWEVYRIGGDEFMALYFDDLSSIDITNTTSARVRSDDYSSFHKMVEDVDKLVTEKKAKLNRRRGD